MAKTRGTGLLMRWTDVDPQHEAEFNRWYDEEHLEAWNRVRDANPWTWRVRHHMRLDAGSPVVYKRIPPRLGA